MRIFFFSAVFLFSCASAAVDKSPVPVKIAVIGSTFPDSPFTGKTNKLETLRDALIKENPDIVLHTGNIVYGGLSLSGIRGHDLERQFADFFSCFSGSGLQLYTVPGETDYFNIELTQYIKYSGRNADYSFNYGNIHFVALAYNSYALFSEKQELWLEKDIKLHEEYPCIIVFMRGSLVSKSNDIPALKKKLHGIFLKNNVRAVISGEGPGFKKVSIDGIEYFSAETSGFTQEKKCWKCTQYYIMNFINNEFHVKEGILE